jgi:hypothetical protein
MKKINILYWVFTGFFAAFMALSAIGNIVINPESLDLISAQLGYPKYIIPFLGVAKVLGAIVILIPGFPRLKEWAYAGLFFDLLGATYSVIAVTGFEPSTMFMLIFFVLLFASYLLYHKRREMKEAEGGRVAMA